MANFQLGDTEQVPYSLIELDADSQPALTSPSDIITIVSSNTKALQVVPDATPAAGTQASGLLVGGPGVALGVTVTATVQRTSGPVLSVTDTIDVVGGVASSLSLGLGAPVAQPTGGTTPPPPGP